MTSVRRCEKCETELSPGMAQGLCPRCLLAAGFGPTSASSDSGSGKQNVEPELLQEAVARDFPHLELQELLGRGGMGVVYKARQPALDRTVALKVLSPRCQNDPAFAERFSREARALGRLSHPNIVALHDYGQANGRYYLLMEYVDGINLREALQQGRFSPQEALTLIPFLCEALQYAHEKGIVHRDIKPENILIDTTGKVKIADFGLAKLLDPEGRDYKLTETTEVLGTPHYMAPEQLGRSVTTDHRADIYALGVVIYEMLTGELPVGRFAPPSSKVLVDVRMDDVVLRTLENEPSLRYQSARAVKDDVDRISSTPPPAASPDAAPRPAGSSTYPGSGSRPEKSPARLVPVPVLIAVGFLGLLILATAAGSVGYILSQTNKPAQTQSGVTPVLQVWEEPYPSVRPAQPVPTPALIPPLSDALQELQEQWETISPSVTLGTVVAQGRGIMLKQVGESTSRLRAPQGWKLLVPRYGAERNTIFTKLVGPESGDFYLTRFGPDGLRPYKAPYRFGYYDVFGDGELVVFDYKDQEGETRRLMTWSPSTGRTDLLPLAEGGVYPAFSPDGQVVAYCATRKLRLYNLLTGDSRILVDDPLLKELPAWSPDGEWIVYQASSNVKHGYNIYRARLADGHVEQLTSGTGANANPCYSPDGTQIVFASNSANVESQMAIHTMNADGSNRQKDPTSPVNVYFPRW